MRRRGAYATGVLVLMTSAAFAVTLAARADGKRWVGFVAVTLVFVYTTVTNVIERPEGMKIAVDLHRRRSSAVSMLSRTFRATELRVLGVKIDNAAEAFIDEAATAGTIRIIAHRPDRGTEDEYSAKLNEARESHSLHANDLVLFLEVQLSDASTFSHELRVRGLRVGRHRVLRCSSPAIPNAIAALMLHVRDETGLIPHAYFGWTEGNPLAYVLKYLALGEGDTAPVTREVLRQAEADPERRPRIHLG